MKTEYWKSLYTYLLALAMTKIIKFLPFNHKKEGWTGNEKRSVTDEIEMKTFIFWTARNKQ
jgi:hypothetical protein